MAKDKLSEYDATAANNTVVGDVNLAENSCLPSDVNNAIREVMSHQKEAFGSATPLFVDQTNNRLGIGIASPSSILHTSVSSGANKLIVQNTAASQQSVLQLNTDSTTPGQCQIYMGKTSAPTNGQVGYDPSSDFMYFYTNNSEKLRLTSAGSLGLGESNPATTVHITASAPALSLNTAASMTSGNRADINVYNSDRSGVGLIRFGAVTDNVGTNMQFYTRPASGSLTEAFRVDSSQNLLVGKTTLEYDSNTGHIFRADGLQSSIRSGGNVADFNRLSSDGEIIRLSKDGTDVGSIGIQYSGFYIDGESGHEGIRFANGAITPRENGSDSDGASDLGATNNRFKDGYFSGILYSTNLRGQNDTDTGIDIGNTGSTADIINFFTSGSERARFTTSQFMVGKTSGGLSNTGHELGTDGYVYHVRNGNIMWLNTTASSANAITFMQSASTVGSIVINSSSTTYNTSSDRRLKYNIEDAASASDKIDAIQVRQFDWKADDIHQDYGLIAQELQPIEPIAVTGDADSDKMMEVDYSKLVPMLIKEIQELRSRVATLEAS